LNNIDKDTSKLINTIKNGIEEVKGNNIKILDLRELYSSPTNFYIVCHGTSNTQVKAITESIIKFTEKELNITPSHKEGLAQAEWVLLDYFNIIVHVFQENQRFYYDIENLWADAEEIKN